MAWLHRCAVGRGLHFFASLKQKELLLCLHEVRPECTVCKDSRTPATPSSPSLLPASPLCSPLPGRRVGHSARSATPAGPPALAARPARGCRARPQPRRWRERSRRCTCAADGFQAGGAAGGGPAGGRGHGRNLSLVGASSRSLHTVHCQVSLCQVVVSWQAGRRWHACVGTLASARLLPALVCLPRIDELVQATTPACSCTAPG